MRKLLLFHVLYMLCLVNILGQSLYDNTWTIGITNSITTINWQKGAEIKYNENSQAYMRLSISSANDAKGNFLFYTQGCAILGKDYKILPNGKQINPGEQHDNGCGAGSTGGEVLYNVGIFLPKPKDTTLYYLFHTPRGDKYANTIAFPPDKLYYTVIDASKEVNGDVVKKNVLIIKDTLSFQGPRACKHANGQDWWIVIPEFETHGYYSVLLTKDSVVYVKRKVFSSDFGRELGDRAGQTVFSPDGSKYIRSDPFNGTYIYDFDRCSGELSKPIFIDTLGTYACAGVAVSPNSKYLYLSNRNVLHQFDLQANNIAQSKIKIADYDGQQTSFGSSYSFYKMALAPNGKIYMATTNTTDALHTIHSPNEKGIACDFKQHDFPLPDYNYVTMTNFPNFNLGVQSGTPCAPLITNHDVQETNLNISILPNPSDDVFEINANFDIKKIIITDVNGEVVKKISVNNEKNVNLEVYSFKNGLYFISIFDCNGKMMTKKITVIH